MKTSFPLKAVPGTQSQTKAGTEIFSHPLFKEAGVWDIIKDLVHPKPRPFDCLQVEITSHCSARCSYCPHTTHAQSWQGQHMEARTFANLWPLLQQSTRVHLQGWGEPLLHPHFLDFVAFARKAGCAVSTTSCGLHLNENVAKSIFDSGIDILAFSLAGTDAESNSARQGADFHKVCEKIRLLQELRKKHWAVHLDIHVAYILLADRMEAVLGLPDLMQELAIHTAVVSTLDYVPQPHLQELALRPEEKNKIAKARTLLQEASARAKSLDKDIHYALPSLTTTGHCRENIQKNMYITAAGQCSPCVYLNIPAKQASSFPQAIFGNVNSQHPLDIWHGEEFTRFRQSHGQGDPNHPLCHSCIKRHEDLG